jgi:hypothetical protein
LSDDPDEREHLHALSRLRDEERMLLKQAIDGMTNEEVSAMVRVVMKMREKDDGLG